MKIYTAFYQAPDKISYPYVGIGTKVLSYVQKVGHSEFCMYEIAGH